MTGNPDDTTPRPPSPDPQRVIQTEPEQCDACDMPMALYAQLTNPDKGIAYAVIGATKDIHGLEVWYECDECDAVEELGFLDDLAPAEVEALRTFAAGQGWRAASTASPSPAACSVPGSPRPCPYLPLHRSPAGWPRNAGPPCMRSSSAWASP